MGLLDRGQRKVTELARQYIDEPVLSAANFGWVVSVQTPSSFTSHPELAGGLPEVVVVAVTEQNVHLLSPEVSRITHEAKRGSAYVSLGSWPRGEVDTVRLDQPTVWLGREMPTLPTIELKVPGYDAAQLAGAQGANAAFLRLLNARQAPKA